MAIDNVAQFELHMIRARHYHKSALWQEKLRALQSALEICEKSELPQTRLRRQDVLFEVGGIRRRFGQHKEGICTLHEALQASEDPDSLKRAQILGELGVLYRHVNQYDLARSTFKQQYVIASQQGIDGEAEICRALGNEGMAIYNIYQSTTPTRPELLLEAFDKLEARVLRAQKLHDRLLRDDPHSPSVSHSLIWQKIGMDRLTLCYIAAGNTSEAVLQAEASQRLQTEEEPTVTGYSRFFYGNALWHNGQQEKARHVWSAPVGVCSAVHSICKKPTDETVGYLSLLASAGVDFDTYDEQGFSPLDYTVLSDSEDARKMVGIVSNALRASIRHRLERSAGRSQGNAGGNGQRPYHEIVTEQVEEGVSVRLRLANVRRYYRSMLQENFRPELRKQDLASVAPLRDIYAKLLIADPQKAAIFDNFNFIMYSDFKARGKLPVWGDFRHSSSEMTATRLVDNESSPVNERSFTIFFSYRWLGNNNSPDDEHGVQYNRMINAVEALLQYRKDLVPENIGLWLDCACIMQEDPELQQRGIDTLPFAVLQCDAMISLVDDLYYTRAWCAVEVNLIQELIKSYHVHTWWEHILHDPAKDPFSGTLRAGGWRRPLEISKLQLTKEKIDRPKVEFLLRQSKLLGRDDA